MATEQPERLLDELEIAPVTTGDDLDTVDQLSRRCRELLDAMTDEDRAAAGDQLRLRAVNVLLLIRGRMQLEDIDTADDLPT